jgi:hypothetical protein
MWVLKLGERFLNLGHVTAVCLEDDVLEVVTPYEVVRLTGDDAERVLEAMERLAEQTNTELDLEMPD